MAKQSYRDLDDVALVNELDDTRKELFTLRFQSATGQLTNYAKLGQTRKNIARLETELRAREIAAAENQENP
jgi:large subunit ribosomal protein L29